MSMNKVSGTILHTDKQPFRRVTVEVYDRDGSMDERLAIGETDAQGRFDISYDPSRAGWRDLPDLKVKVFQVDSDGKPQLIYEEDGPDDVTGDYDFGTISINHWEYDPNVVVPLIYTSDLIPPPQNFVQPQAVKLGKASIPLQEIYGKHMATGNENLTNAQVQDDYGSNQTMEDADSRSDAYLVNAILNGFAPAFFTKSSDGKYHVRYNYDAYTFDGVHQIPNVHATLSVDNDTFSIESITCQVRKKDVQNVTGPDDFEAAVTSRPGDSNWEQAKTYFRVAEFLSGQAHGHLGRAHLNMGQYAISMYRNLQYNPVFKLLNPHLRGVTPINHTGKGVIFGETGALAALSPLTADSLLEYMRDDLGQCNWRDWSPRKPITSGHQYAKIQEQYWELAKEHVEVFFRDYEPQIIRNWEEIYHFAQELVSNSVAYFQHPLADGEDWYDRGEYSPPTENGKAVSLITGSTHNPSDQEIANLKQACAYVIFHCTLWHCWRNDNQVNYGGEVEYARLALEYTPVESSYQLMVVHLLVDVKHGYVTKNEEGDIPRDMIQSLKKQADTFGAEDYNIDVIRSRINI